MSDRQTQINKLKVLFESAAIKCPDLRDAVVMPEGNPNAGLVILGEAPGLEEEKAGRPFVGPAGELLKAAMLEAGYRKNDVWLTNVLKFRPEDTKKSRPGEVRTPTWDEITAFRFSLGRELQVIEPRLILCVGGTAIRAVLGDRTIKVTDNLQKVFVHPKLPVRVAVTYHPSFVLRTGGAGSYNYRLLVNDLKWAKQQASKPQ